MYCFVFLFLFFFNFIFSSQRDTLMNQPEGFSLDIYHGASDE